MTKSRETNYRKREKEREREAMSITEALEGSTIFKVPGCFFKLPWCARVTAMASKSFDSFQIERLGLFISYYHAYIGG